MLNTCAHRICRTTEPCRYGNPSAPEREPYGSAVVEAPVVKLDETITRPNDATHIIERRLAAHPVAITYCRRSLDLAGAEIVEGAVVTCELCTLNADEAAVAALVTSDPAERAVLEAFAARLDALPTDDQLVESFDADDEPAHTLLVVPCSKTKLEHATVARELYRGTLTRMGLTAAAVIERGHLNVSTAILSALHGITDLDAVVAPYDVTWGDTRAISATEIAAQLTAAGVQRVVALTPNRYTDALEAACEIAGVELVAALRGCRGIFEQRGRLADYRRSGGISSHYTRELPELGLVHAGPVASR